MALVIFQITIIKEDSMINIFLLSEDIYGTKSIWNG